MPLLLEFMKTHNPDVICLQETKVVNELFPADPILEAGYQHIHFHGMKSYNGVAILSKIPFQDTRTHSRVDQDDCRHIAVTLQSDIYKDGIDIHCLYVPAGGDEPDRAINPKFGHKLDFIDEMAQWFPAQYKKDRPVIAVGDFNIAPEEHDVWSHKQLLKVISHTPIEVEKLANMQKALGWVDAIRHFVPSEEKCYSWWSYRNRDWKKSNRGRRLDHIWVTQPLKDKLKSHEILNFARDWIKPSDHVPVIIDLDL